MELVMNLGDNIWLIIIAIVVIAIIAFLLLRPRQRVQLGDSTPLRPHMIDPKPEAEGRGLDGEAAAAASDVVGEIIRAPVHEALAAGEEGDEFTQLKGVGPKFADALHAQGIHRFEQLSKLTPVEIERLDSQLGPFRGRLQRDRVVEQADYLGRGDRDGFEERFGKL
jgi:predicted flap endonuclease-1-like 5' DNA nuclease